PRTAHFTVPGHNVTDPPTAAIPPTGATLAYGSNADYTTSYTISQADVDNNGHVAGSGNVTNTATAASDETASQSASASTGIDYKPGLSISKTVTSVSSAIHDGQVHDAGDVITYKVHVANTGDVTLTGLSVTDPLTGATLASGATLGGGGSADYTTSYTVTQADIDNHGHVTGSGNVVNTAYATDAQAANGQSSVSVGVVNNFTTASSKALSAGFWANHQSDWDGVNGNDAKAAQLVSAGTLAQK